MVTAQDLALLRFDTYGEYLDSFLNINDLHYIRNIRICRQLAELGYRSATDILSEEAYDARKDSIMSVLFPRKGEEAFFSRGRRYSDPVLDAIAIRETPNNQKFISTIIFLKHRCKNGFEKSCYIDYDSSLKNSYIQRPGCTDWRGIFDGTVKLRPKRSHMSYFDWHGNEVAYNNTSNYFVIPEHEHGLIFMHKGDRKKICTDMSQKAYNMNCRRTVAFSKVYGHVVFLDHLIRKKN